MAIHFVCPNCLARLRFGDSESGQKRRCRKCQTELTIPGEALPVTDRPPSRVTRWMIEMVIAVVLVVGVAVGAWMYYKSYMANREAQRRQMNRVGETGPVVTNIPSKTNNKPVPPPPQMLTAGQELKLGPAQVKVTSVTSVKETGANKMGASAGKKFALVQMEVRSVSPGPSFDTQEVGLVTAAGKVYRSVSLIAEDERGNQYEVTRKQISAPMSFGLYYEVPTELDAGTCRLVYQ